MRVYLQTALAALLLCGSFGCHCMPVTERYCDAVDCIADQEIDKDRYYRPAFDVTRWGMWNGPECCRRNQCRPHCH